MRSFNLRSALIKSGLAVSALLLSGGAFAQQQINLTAGPATATLPDGSAVPMWGYSCGTTVTGSTASCRALLQPAPLTAATWSPVVITVPTGQDLQINLTNQLTFTPTTPAGSAANTIPTSLVIVGQLGGGLGSTATSDPASSWDHTNAQPVTWPIAGTGPGQPPVGVGVPPVQGPRVRSMATEVAAGAGITTANTVSLCWGLCPATVGGPATGVALKPGTYLLESGTHPSIQGAMGLYGILVVTAAPGSTAGTTAGCAYPGATPTAACVVLYDADVPMLFSEIDPVQNIAVNAAVNTAGFSETKVWSGQSLLPSIGASGCGAQFNADGSANANWNTCYPPAVNYTPLYYLINGVAYDKTHPANSLFATAPATGVAATGSVLVRLVNAGLRMHVPSIVGSQTGTAVAPAVPPSGFALIAEDGNVLPGVRRVQSEVFMAAGKTNDVIINAANTPASTSALPIYDRELSLSGNAIARDTGMLAYISVNSLGVPVAAATATATNDQYGCATTCTSAALPGLVAGQPLVILDPSKGVLANDINVFGVRLSSGTACTSPVTTTPCVTLNADGTFVFMPGTATSGSFSYCGNGATSGAACATVAINQGPQEAASGITMANITYNANATFLKIQPPGVLSVDKDAAGYPLTVAMSTGNTPVAGAGLTLSVDANGGFTASVTTAGTYTFTYKAQNSQGTVSATTATVTINFPAATNLSVTVKDGTDKTTVISDYRWIIEEDRTFYVNPNCTTNPPPPGCPGSATAGQTGPGIVPTFGTNFHASYMPVIATGCTGTLSCEGGQTIFNPATGTHDSAVCDIGNGVCESQTAPTGFTQRQPSTVHLDPTKRYYISVLPGDAANPFEALPVGHGMGGAPIVCPIVPPATTCAAFPPVTIYATPTPYPPTKLSIFVFEDDFFLNGEHDGGGGIDVLAPNEPGLGSFNITLFDDAGGTGDATGQMTYDMFNYPLSNGLAGTIDPATGQDACPISTISQIGTDPLTGFKDLTQTGITGTIVTCPKYEADGKTLSPLAGQVVIANLMPGRYGVVATPGADRIARGEEWLQTNTIDGQKAHDSFLRIGEPSFFQEYGPAGYHVSIGFANPAIINSRLPYVCNGTDPNVTGTNCTNTLNGFVSTMRMSRTPDQRLYGSGDYSSFAFTQCYVSVGDVDGEDFAFTKCDANGNFTLTGLPDGQWRVSIFDQWNDMLVDGLSTPVALNHTVNGGVMNLGEISKNQWQTNIYTKTFLDLNRNGLQDVNEPGLTLVVTNNRFRDGSYSNFNNTDLQGNAGFNEIFPLFSWYVMETDSTRYKNTGTHVVYDAGGPADGTPCGTATTPHSAPCKSSVIAGSLANTFETVSLPTTLRIPGAVYCNNADCTGHSILSGPGTSDAPSSCTISPTTGDTSCTGTALSTGRIDPPWVTSEAWQGFSGQNEFIEFGKALFAPANGTLPAENGGIYGHVVYASTRPFDDPQLLLQTSWEPLVPGVTINLYQEVAAPDGNVALKLVDTTKTSSWDDWAQGFYPNTNKPYMNCPGQLAAPTTAASGDLFFYTLYNQPMWLDVYSNSGTPAHTMPNNSQFKCYDGMHNWNQVQPAPYDGRYQFPSIVSRDPTSGVPTGAGSTYGTAGSMTGTNCTICVANPVTATEPMLPAGKYVVEVVVPPGFELVKEEDKNILIGDVFIAPVTAQFGALASIYIMPDQASVAAFWNSNQGSRSAYNSTNAQNPTQAFGRASSLPSHEGDTGSVETFPPCVGKARIIPDFISLFPQSAEVSPFAGAVRNLCDRKEVQLDDQTTALAKFYIFTSAHAAAHFTGIITDDFTAEFDPFSPQFGEKFSPANLPVAIKDWTGNEISRVYADQWGTYNGLTFSTWEVNPPNPTGYSPQMMVTCMNDPGTGATPDPLYNPAYSQFCYEIPFMPAQTQYMDTPVIPTSAFAGAGYNNPDCEYPDATPAISEVDGTGVGPWLSAPGALTIRALGTVPINNNAYSGPAATTAPFNQKTQTRRYSFGSTTGGLHGVRLVSLDGTQSMDLTSVSWGDMTITATVPAFPTGTSAAALAWNCPVQQQAQYGGPSAPAKCGQLVITAANGRQSIDTVTVTVGGKAPTHVAANASVQSAIDNAMPGDMLMIDPATQATATAPAVPAIHTEMLLMWKPLRLQGVGAVSSVLNGNTHPAGETKIAAWRRQVDCLFGLTLSGYGVGATLVGVTNTADYDPSGTYSCAGGTNGANFSGSTTTLTAFAPTPANPQVDRLPLESVIGWNAALNGNLAELLQEPSLMGALEGATITVLSKGVQMPANATDIFGANAAVAGTYPAGTVLLDGSTNTAHGCNAGTTAAPNHFPSNFYCNPSSIDGLTIANSSQGGGGIFVHGWGHKLQIANNRVTNNAGTLSGGINVGQGEFPTAYTVGGINPDPGSCQSPAGLPAGTQLQYCLNVQVNMQHNAVTKNSSVGDELFSATPAGAGGVSICTGSDYYKFNYNWVCGNLSTGDGGGVAHIGFSYYGDIEHNSILFNQSTNPTIATNGGGLLIEGAPDADPPCGGGTDADCVPNPPVGPADGAGPGLVINANLIQGNAAESGSGGGIRLQNINGSDVLAFPTAPTRTVGTTVVDNWYHVKLTNNILTNNVAGWDGAGIALHDALYVDIVNNTIANNDTTASSGVLFNTVGAPRASAPGPCSVPRNPDGTCPAPWTTSLAQPAGIVVIANSAQLTSNLPATINCPPGHFSGSGTSNQNCRTVSYPVLYNNILWHNRSFTVHVGTLGTGPLNQQNVVTLHPTLTQPSADATTANGAGRTITGGTGACVTEPAFSSAEGGYWDIGMRGDTTPTTNGAGLTPAYSVISSGPFGSGTGNTSADPTMISQYCNGARVPPENGGLGYNTPAGISDAQVPNPIFNLTPVATVDEGNNWINMDWGPLSLANTSNGSLNGTTLGNYGLTSTSTSAINHIPATGASAPFYIAAPSTDFYGNNRKTGTPLAVDAGAVEYQSGTGVTAHLSVSGGPLAFGNVPVTTPATTSAAQTLTVTNTDAAQGGTSATLTVGTLAAPFSRPAAGPGSPGPGSCAATTTTLGPGASCTINVVFTPTATTASSASLALTSSSGTVANAPVALSGTGVTAVTAATLTPNPATMSAARGCNASSCPMQGFTLTNTGNVTLAGISSGTLAGTNASEFSIVPLLSTCGTLAGQATSYPSLAPGNSCVVTVRFSPTGTTGGSRTATLSVSATGLTPTPTSTINGTAQ